MSDTSERFHPSLGFEDPMAIESTELRATFLEAQGRFVDSEPHADQYELVEQLTARLDDPDLIQRTLEQQRPYLPPETVFLLTMSAAVMRARHARQYERNVADMNS